MNWAGENWLSTGITSWFWSLEKMSLFWFDIIFTKDIMLEDFSQYSRSVYVIISLKSACEE